MKYKNRSGMVYIEFLDIYVLDISYEYDRNVLIKVILCMNSYSIISGPFIIHIPF